jgi:hypothetical protein
MDKKKKSTATSGSSLNITGLSGAVKPELHEADAKAAQAACHHRALPLSPAAAFFPTAESFAARCRHAMAMRASGPSPSFQEMQWIAVVC